MDAERAVLRADLVTRCAAALRAGLRRVMELRCVHAQLPLGAVAVRKVCGKAVGLCGACRVARCPGDEAMQQRCVRTLLLWNRPPPPPEGDKVLKTAKLEWSESPKCLPWGKPVAKTPRIAHAPAAPFISFV